jgi:hypothetical protein
MCKEIPINRVVDKKRLIGKNVGLRRRRQMGLLTKKSSSILLKATVGCVKC